MFYRLLVAQSSAAIQTSILHPLPCVTPETRDSIVREIDWKGVEAFTMDSLEELERDNAELLQMAHNFASRQRDYLGVMQGFALLYRSLVLQAAADRSYLH